MTALEKLVRQAWVDWGSYAQWTVCADCTDWRYCRSRGGKRFLCLACFDQHA